MGTRRSGSPGGTIGMKTAAPKRYEGSRSDRMSDLPVTFGAGTIIDGQSASPWNPPGRRS